eukprot:CAMPEP_0168540688 /NCGR_PEP_ID=MMETSP0413-20121227/411_1 /TAXON_ID=136452 /ORGANISM="Filamoeba nolandi, Strain NC-AS-23-1" /LENGTH=348 /DNA_ID=CAMNT_0008570441 /DNA_START=1 /DNA_END=1045 /DNA_ORIENTATION=+
MQIFIKSLHRTLVLQTDSSQTVGTLKHKIFHEELIPLDEQRLIFGGKQLEDDSSISNYNITNNATIHLTLRSLLKPLTEGVIVAGVSAAVINSGLSQMKLFFVIGLGVIWWVRNERYFVPYMGPTSFDQLRKQRYSERRKYNHWPIPPDPSEAGSKEMVRSVKIHSERAVEEFHKTGKLDYLKRLCNLVIIDRIVKGEESTQQVINSWALRSLTKEAMELCFQHKLIDVHARVRDKPPVSPDILSKMKEVALEKRNVTRFPSGTATGYYGEEIGPDPTIGVVAAWTGNMELIEMLRKYEGYSDTYLAPFIQRQTGPESYYSYAGSPLTVEETLIAVERAQSEKRKANK